MWKRTFQLTSVLALEVWPGLWSEASIRTWMLLHSSFKHWSTLCLIHPVYSLRDSCGESNYFELSSTLLLVTLRLLFISLAFPRPRGFQSAQWVACTNILPLYIGNRWVNTAESLKHFPLLLLDYQLPFRASYAQMSAKINGALSAALIRSGLALPLLIRDFFFNLKQKRNQVEPMSDSPIFSAPPTPRRHQSGGVSYSLLNCWVGLLRERCRDGSSELLCKAIRPVFAECSRNTAFSPTEQLGS